MNHMKRLVCVVLALALCGAFLLTGCSAPRLTIGGTAKTAATIGDTTLSTGEYLAYLYNSFYNLYYSQGLYRYAQYGSDVWSQEYTYGEGDDAQKVKFDEYLKLSAQDAAVRQVALRQLMTKYSISWNAEEQKELETNLENVKADSYLSLGISKENFVKVTKELSLNETGLFYGLYGEGGQREMSEADRRAYFDENYLSYKMISISLTDSSGSEMTDDAKKRSPISWRAIWRNTIRAATSRRSWTNTISPRRPTPARWKPARTRITARTSTARRPPTRIW